MDTTSAVICGIVGAVLSELIKQKGKWSSMTNEMFLGQFKRIAFWLIIFVLLACGGISGYLIYEDFADSIKYKHCFAAGAGAEAFVRQLASTAYNAKDVELGSDVEIESLDSNEYDDRKPRLPSIKDILS